jgi:hypothetical protein
MNREEARAVAEDVIRHYLTNPEVSLGVGTFSAAQQNAVLEEVEARRLEHPELDVFFGRDREEHFFVKNLETIQGDQRDVILVSIGYGFDFQGRFSRNLGPVNPEGGERRLNVLFSRAKKRCVLYSNFLADDLAVEGHGSRGLHVLKTILKYAATGILPEEEVIRVDPSPRSRPPSQMCCAGMATKLYTRLDALDSGLT